MRTSMFRALAGVTAASLIVLATACGAGGVGAPQKKHDTEHLRIGLLPKFTSDPYFTAVNKGAQQAAKQLGVTVVYNGPVNADTAQQSNIIEQWTQEGFDAITVSANDPNAVIPALKKAKAAGIKISAFDADYSQKELPHPFMNQVTVDDMGATLADAAGSQSGGKGTFLIMTSTLTAPNQNTWIAATKKHLAKKYPHVKILATLPGNEELSTSKSVATNYLQAHPHLTGILCVDGVAQAGAAQAVQQLGLGGKVIVTGIGVPNTVRPYIKKGVIKQAVLWDPSALGYATVQMAVAQIKGKLPPSGTFHAGDVGELRYGGENTIIEGKPLVFTAKNIDDYHF